MTANAVAPIKPIDRFKQELTLRHDHIKALLPKSMSYEKFQGIVISAVADNMSLLDCDRGSLIKACLTAAELGLSLNKAMAEADILASYGGKDKPKVAQFRPRYKGLMRLATQSGDVLKIESRLVYENDLFEVDEGIESRITHKHGLANRGEMIGAYCVWKLKNGEMQFEIMSKEQIEEIRNRSEGWKAFAAGKIKSTPWSTDPAEMWRKTVVRRATKYMPLSTEAQRAVAIDNAAEGIEDIEGDYMDITDTGDGDAPSFDFDPDTGEVYEEPKPQPGKKAAVTQLQAIADKVAPVKSAVVKLPVVSDDVSGDPDWNHWVAHAYEAVEALSPEDRQKWRAMHSGELDEAEFMSARNLGKLFQLFN